MKIQRRGQAGTMQSSDLMVIVEPADALSIEIESTVKQQFEHLIRARIEAVLAKHGAKHLRVSVNDRGALDYAIEARLAAALQRAGGQP
ncbi:MAG: citrate lyase acyl carrier protein [Betaproteobacteria bacterium HGW-Betaproteobacteria-12]|nr:MAG: citrate lyase acyl carrier protein [Betaproteobacteria bacterium HGW-Betaproteobacteria-12]